MLFCLLPLCFEYLSHGVLLPQHHQQQRNQETTTKEERKRTKRVFIENPCQACHLLALLNVLLLFISYNAPHSLLTFLLSFFLIMFCTFFYAYQAMFCCFAIKNISIDVFSNRKAFNFAEKAINNYSHFLFQGPNVCS